MKNHKILTEGEVGRGLLIENDSGFTTKCYKEDKGLNETLSLDKQEVESSNGIVRILVDCILQKANVQNRNGRVYPKPILEREVNKYQQSVQDLNSFGECVDGETEIFTTNGWKLIKDISETEEVFTLDRFTNELEKEVILAKIDRDYNDVMYHIYNNESIDMMITANHKILLFDDQNNPFSLHAIDFVNAFRANTEDEWFKKLSINVSNEVGVLTLIPVSFETLTIDEIDYSGKVYCVTTKNHTWLMKRNGKIAWTMNCNHPTEATISLKKDDVSHIIRKFWWEGDTLFGTLEIITSKGYSTNGGIYCVGDHIANLLERGYKLGISSRGLGSVKTIAGKNIVQNDFDLICWDLVSSPSTPDAYLAQDSKSINESYNNELTKKESKNSSLRNFLQKN